MTMPSCSTLIAAMWSSAAREAISKLDGFVETGAAIDQARSVLAVEKEGGEAQALDRVPRRRLVLVGGDVANLDQHPPSGIEVSRPSEISWPTLLLRAMKSSRNS